MVVVWIVGVAEFGLEGHGRLYRPGSSEYGQYFSRLVEVEQ